MPKNMKDLAELISSASGARLEVIGEDDTRIVVDLELARKQSRAIKKRYGISVEQAP